MRRFPKGDRKALWSPPQRRFPLQHDHNVTKAYTAKPFKRAIDTPLLNLHRGDTLVCSTNSARNRCTKRTCGSLSLITRIVKSVTPVLASACFVCWSKRVPKPLRWNSGTIYSPITSADVYCPAATHAPTRFDPYRMPSAAKFCRFIC